MNKADLVRHIAASAGLSQEQAAKALESIVQGISNTLVEGGQVSLINWGQFSLKERAERTGRNPKTGEEIQIPSKKVVNFKPGKQLRDRVNS